MFFILSFIFSCVWALFATYMVRDSPKTCLVSIALMSVIVYYLY